jgi:hypothetical protein
MEHVWKEALLPGRVMDPRTQREYRISARQIAQAHKNFQLMLQRGVPVPQVFEHVDLEAGDPEAWRANYAKYCFGHLGAAKISTAEDVAARIATRPGTLLLRCDIADPEDKKRLAKCKFVSPKIRPTGWMDSRGETYEGATLTHLALTPSPAQFWQRPFQLSDSEAVYLSCVLEEEPPSKTSLFDDTDADSESQKCPEYRETSDEWLAGLDALELSTTDAPEAEEENAVAEESKEKPEKKGDGEGDSKNADLKSVMDAIKKAFPSAVISDRVSNWAELCIALESQAGAEESAADDSAALPDEETSAPAGGPPMMMSTLDKDERKRKLATNYAKPEREEAVSRINAAFKGDGKRGRDPKTARQLLRRAEAVEMSFTSDFEAGGPRWTKLLADIAAYEKSEPKVSLKADGSVDLSTTEVVPLPTNTGDATSDDNNPVLKFQRELAAQHSVTAPKK